MYVSKKKHLQEHLLSQTLPCWNVKIAQSTEWSQNKMLIFYFCQIDNTSTFLKKKVCSQLQTDSDFVMHL